MKGSIRIIFGWVLVLGGVGSIELSTEAFPVDGLLTTLAGIGIMAWGVIALNLQLMRDEQRML